MFDVKSAVQQRIIAIVVIVEALILYFMTIIATIHVLLELIKIQQQHVQVNNSINFNLTKNP